jgi:hypothetical protein
MTLTFFEHQDERLALTTLFVSNKPGVLYFGAGTYDENGWTGKEYGGYVPVSDLLAWAVERGFVKERES